MWLQVKAGLVTCHLRDNTEVLDSTPATVSVARRADVELVEVDLSEGFIPHLPVWIKRGCSKLHCGFCGEENQKKIILSCLFTDTDSWWYLCTPFHPSEELRWSQETIVSISLTTERVIQRKIRLNGDRLPRGCRIPKDVVGQVLDETEGRDLLPQLHDHMFETCWSKLCSCSGEDWILLVLWSSIQPFCKRREWNVQKRQNCVLATE